MAMIGFLFVLVVGVMMFIWTILAGLFTKSIGGNIKIGLLVPLIISVFLVYYVITNAPSQIIIT